MSSVPDTDYRELLLTHDGPAARIVLNRPERRNALSLGLIEEMIAAVDEVSAWRDARAIVIEERWSRLLGWARPIGDDRAR